MKVLVVDDEKIVSVPLCDELREAGYEVASESDGLAALAHLAEEPFDVVISDLRMPGMDGLALLKQIRETYPHIAVIMITAYGTVENAVEAMKQGAYDYVLKPFDTDQLLIVLNRIAEHKNLTAENRRLKAQLMERHGFHNIVGQSAAMQKVYDALDIVCACDCTVLVTGKTGTGKEMVADAIHYNSARKNGPLVKVSCAALSRDVLESELFGHVRGAFTGAIQDRKGRFELAHGGTIFLDEVDDIPMEVQVKLLRVLENQEFERVGDEKTQRVDVRVIAATKVDLKERIVARAFRDDLFYRLNVVPIYLPALSERREDIPLLISHFSAQSQGAFIDVDNEAMALLMAYDWPGNVRELKNAMARLMLVRKSDRIGMADLPLEIRDYAEQDSALDEGSFDEIISSIERRLLIKALENANGNKTRAAELLKMTPSTFRYKLSALNLD